MTQNFADWLVYDIFGLSSSTALGTAVNFFFYDSIKIIILLFFISILMGIINAYFPIERLRNYLITHKMYGLQYLLASLFGAITPFCSCSSIPLFIGFVKGGIPLGVTFAFLITSPLVNEVAVAMFLGSFGVKITLVYVLSGILLGVIGGFVLGRMNLHPYLSDWVKQIQANSSAQADDWEKEHTTFLKRLRNRYRSLYARLCARRFLRGVPVQGQLAGRTALGHSRRTNVCQCRRYRSHHRSLCSQGNPYRHCHRLYDGGSWPVIARSYTTQKSNELAPHRHFLRHGGVLHHSFRLSV